MVVVTKQTIWGISRFELIWLNIDTCKDVLVDCSGNLLVGYCFGCIVLPSKHITTKNYQRKKQAYRKTKGTKEIPDF